MEGKTCLHLNLDISSIIKLEPRDKAHSKEDRYLGFITSAQFTYAIADYIHSIVWLLKSD